MHKALFYGAVGLASLPLPALARPAVATADAPDRSAQPADEAPIIVTAAPYGLGRDNTSAISAHVDRDQILHNGGATLADALANVPGISGSGFASGASRPIIRGMDSTRVRLVEDGLSASDVSDVGPDHGTPIDPLAARSIEVVRGAATLRYGSQAIGGVVNAINNRVPATLGARAFSGELTGSYDSASDGFEGAVLADARAGDFALHADAFYRHADDYSTPLGTQANSFFRGSGQSIGGSWFPGAGDSRFGAAIQHYGAEYGIPSDDSYIDMRQTKFVTRSSIDLGGGALETLKLDGSYADYRHHEREPDGAIVATFLNREYDGRAELLFAPLGAVENSALGVEARRRRYSALGEASSYLLPTLTWTSAAYLFTNIALGEKLTLEASGRIEHVRLNGTPASGIPARRGYTPLSAAIGALYSFGGGVKLGLTFSSTGRAPAITELFARGSHDGPGTFETGDPNLRTERANSLEATLRIGRGRVRFEGSIYSSWFDNFIYGDLTGRTCDEDGDCIAGAGRELRELLYRQQGAHFRGLEGEASIRLFDTRNGRLEARAVADYVRATFAGGGNVPRIPPWRIGGGLHWQGSRLDAGFTFTRRGRQDDVGAFDTPTAGYDNLDAHVSLRPFASHPGIEFSLVGRNLTDSVQRDAAAFNKDLVVSPGRSIRFVLTIATS